MPSTIKVKTHGKVNCMEKTTKPEKRILPPLHQAALASKDLGCLLFHHFLDSSINSTMQPYLREKWACGHNGKERESHLRHRQKEVFSLDVASEEYGLNGWNIGEEAVKTISFGV